MENNIETGSMNRDVLAGQWKQMRGELKTWWGKLTDDDVDRIAGQKDKLIGLLQERYGYAREQAEQEVERRLEEYGDKTGGAVDESLDLNGQTIAIKFTAAEGNLFQFYGGDLSLNIGDFVTIEGSATK